MTSHDLNQMWYPPFDSLHLSLWQSQQLNFLVLFVGLVIVLSGLVWLQFHPKH
jgi:hypothetical protein